MRRRVLLLGGAAGLSSLARARADGLLLGLGVGSPQLVSTPPASFALVNHAPVLGATNGGDSSGVDTTGANILVFVGASYGGSVATLIDSYSNTWTLRKTGAATDATLATVSIYDVTGTPTVGPGHTVSFTGTGIFASGEFLAFSGASATPFDQGSANFGNFPTSSIQPGSITPSGPNYLLIAGCVEDTAGTGVAATVDSGFTPMDAQGDTASWFGNTAAYLIQTSALAVNPTFTPPSGAGLAAAMVSYLP